MLPDMFGFADLPISTLGSLAWGSCPVFLQNRKSEAGLGQQPVSHPCLLSAATSGCDPGHWWYLALGGRWGRGAGRCPGDGGAEGW